MKTYLCPKCGSFMYAISTASIPPQARYVCSNCTYASKTVEEENWAVPYVVSIILIATSAQMIISLYQSAITIRLTKVFSNSGDVENMSNANGQKK